MGARKESLPCYICSVLIQHTPEHPSLKIVQASHLMELSLSTWLMVEEVTYNYNKCCGSKLVWSYLS